jgi:hypothetical protein
MTARSLGMAMLLVCLPALAQKREPVDTSICSIAAHPSRFHGKVLRIRGTGYNGMEASVLFDSKEGEWNKECGQINLDFHSAASDESTSRFLQLFREQAPEQISSPKCNTQEELKQGLAHLSDPSIPAPAPCLATNIVCISCPRYSIVATFIGKLRYSAKEPGHARFGHLGMFTLQVDVESVSNLAVTDSQSPSKR